MQFGKDVNDVTMNGIPIRNEFNHFGDYLYVILGHDCNLRCKYCFMPKDITELDIHKIHKLLDIIAKEKSYLSIRFYGGEPILHFDKIKNIVGYAKEIGMVTDFALATNGTLLTEKIADFIKAENISVMVSLDGNKETNDTMRVFSNGHGTYDFIERKIRLLEVKGINYQIAVTLDKHNVHNLLPTVEYILNNFRVKTVNLNYPYNLNNMDLKQLINAIMDVNKKLIEKYRLLTGEFYDNFIKTIFEGRTSLYCGGFEGQIVMHPNNNLSPCIALSESPYAVPIEDIDSLKTLYLSSVFSEWRGLITKYTNGTCRGCSYLNICSLGCPYTSMLSGDPTSPDTLICHLTKRVMKETGGGNG